MPRTRTASPDGKRRTVESAASVPLHTRARDDGARSLHRERAIDGQAEQVCGIRAGSGLRRLSERGAKILQPLAT